MGLSLADAAVRGAGAAASGNQFTGTLNDEKRKLLAVGDVQGLLALNRAEFGGFYMGPEDDDDDDDDADEDADSDDEDDEDDGDEDDKGSKRSRASVRIEELSKESKKYRLRAVERGKRVAELEKELAELKNGTKPKPKAKDDEDGDESDASSKELAEARAANEGLSRQNEDLLIRLEFMANNKFSWRNPKAALRLLDLTDVEINDDGEVEGLDEAIAALAKSDPYLLAGKGDGKEDDDKPGSTGQKTGSRKRGNANRDKLVNKYPALRR